MHHKQHQKRTAIRDLHIQEGTPMPTTPAQQGAPLLPPSVPLTSTPAQPLAPPTHTPTAAGRPLSFISTQPLTWLWQDRLPRGSLTLLDGTLGSGKSLVALHLAACLTSGRPLPDGTPCTPCPVIFVDPYGNASHTIAPRLQAAGGDLSQVLFVDSVECFEKRYSIFGERPFTLAEDLTLLETLILQWQAPLVILDTPELAHPAILRRLLPLLARLAQQTNCAILLVHPIHTCPIRKNGSLQPNTGPLDLLTAIPSRLLITPNPEDSQQSLLHTTKHTLSQQPPPLLFQITASPDGVPTLDWLGTYQPPASPEPSPTPPSLPRQHILQHLQHSDTPMNAPNLAVAIDHGYDATRKLLQTMLQDGHLVSPARGLYTTPGHPCLALPATSTPPIAATSSIPIIPSVPTTQTTDAPNTSPPVLLTTPEASSPLPIIPTTQPNARESPSK